MGIKISAKLLDGLTFKTSEHKETTDENGKKTKKYFPIERPLTPDDVLGSADKGDSVVIVTADGQKYAIQKKADKAA